MSNTTEHTTGRRRFSIRRSAAALGAAVAIALGGVATISPAEAHAAGVSRPLVIQAETVQVQAGGVSVDPNRDDEQ